MHGDTWLFIDRPLDITCPCASLPVRAALVKTPALCFSWPRREMMLSYGNATISGGILSLAMQRYIFFMRGKLDKDNKIVKKKNTNLPFPLYVKRGTQKSGINLLKPPS